jgi:hypothetical protein
MGDTVAFPKDQKVADRQKLFSDAFTWEPKYQHKFILSIGDIPSYLVKTSAKPKADNGEVVIDHINIQRKVKGKTKWNNIDITLQLYDTNSATHTAFYSNNIMANGGFLFEADFNTNQNPSSYGAGLYRISINVSAMYVGGGRPPGTGVNGNVTAASDTDGVGAGTFRAANNISNFNAFNPLTNFFLVNGNISGTGIYINKRTSIEVAFN